MEARGVGAEGVGGEGEGEEGGVRLCGNRFSSSHGGDSGLRAKEAEVGEEEEKGGDGG